MAETNTPLPDEAPQTGFASVTRMLSSLPLGGKTTLFFAAVATVLVLTSIIMFGTQPEMKVLYSALPETEAGRVVEQLTKMNIPYELGAGGTTIRIPSNKVYDVRLELATQGIPKSEGVGFEIFDQTGLTGMTDFMQRMNFQRALQGELAKTIESISIVRGARVHLVLPKRSLFVTEDKPPSASVALDLARPLNQNQINGIVHLIASAVEGLSEEEITLVDGKGNLIAGGRRDPGDGRMPTDEGISMQKKIENSLEDRVQTMLDRVLGPNRAITRVTAELDLSRVERLEEKFDPEGQVAKSEQTTTKSVRGQTGVGGVPGVQPNNANAQGQTAGTGSVQSQDEEIETVNYEISKTVNKILLPVGTVKRMSVAVLVDGTYKADDKGTTSYQARSDDEMKQLQRIIEQAVGFSSGRGDTIEVTNIPFEPLPAPESAVSPWEERDFYFELAKYAGLGLLIFLVVMVLLRPLIKKLLIPEKKPLRSGLPTTVSDLEAQLLAEGVGAAADQATRVLIPDKTLQMSQQMITDYSDEAREIIRYWLSEDDY